MKKLLFVFIVMLLSACATAEPEIVTETVEVPVTVEVIQEVEVTVEVPVVEEVEVTRIVTEEVTRIVETMVEVTSTPAPLPAEFLTIDGSGDEVTDNFDWPVCNKAIFAYDATGESNFIVYLWKIGADNNLLLVNEIAPRAGEVLQPLSGGTYWVEVQATGDWSITAVCED